MALSVETTLLFVTLLFLVVIELTNRTSHSILEEQVGLAEVDILGIFPDLGLFSLVHIINSFLLMTGYMVVMTNFIVNDNIGITLILVLTGLLLLILPYLEIEQYPLILSSNTKRLDSWRIHFGFAVAVIFIEPGIFIIMSYLQSAYGIPFANTISAAIFTLVFIVAMWAFLGSLETEIAGLEDDERLVPKRLDQFNSQ